MAHGNKRKLNRGRTNLTGCKQSLHSFNKSYTYHAITRKIVINKPSMVNGLERLEPLKVPNRTN